MNKIPKRSQYNDGPTAILSVDEEQFFIAQQQMQKYLAQYNDLVTANEKSIKELETYLLKHYDCVPYTLQKGELGCFILNVIGNFYKDIYDKYEDAFDIMQDAEHWITELNLQPKAYLITQTNKSMLLYEKQKQEIALNNLQSIPQDIIVQIEATSGWFCVNASNALFEELYLYRGISQQAIDEKGEQLYFYLKLFEKHKQKE